MLIVGGGEIDIMGSSEEESMHIADAYQSENDLNNGLGHLGER